MKSFNAEQQKEIQTVLDYRIKMNKENEVKNKTAVNANQSTAVAPKKTSQTVTTAVKQLETATTSPITNTI